MTELQSFEMSAYRKMMKMSRRETNEEEVLKLTDEQVCIIPTLKKRKITYFGHMIKRNNMHRLILEGQLEGKLWQRTVKNGVDDKYHRMDENAIQRTRENCSRSGAMEDHNSQHSQRRRHLMMMMMMMAV